MVSTLNPATLPTGETAGEKRVTLHNLSWSQYQQLLKALPETRAAHLTYALGALEISMPLEDHEQASELIGLFIRILVFELGLKLKSMRSTTLAREDLNRGAEPDNAYYIQNQPKVAGRNVDLERDPPPDLVVEVDITHTDIDKNALYAAMGVPELWRFNGRSWRIYQLQGDAYAEVGLSPTFPMVEKADLYSFLAAAKQDEISAEARFRNWIKQQLRA
ncbi:MAG: Uma2 family endonuclease [Phormidesmis sp.]